MTKVLTPSKTRTLLLTLFPSLSLLAIHSVWLLLSLNNTTSLLSHLHTSFSTNYFPLTKHFPSKRSYEELCPHVPLGGSVFGLRGIDGFGLGRKLDELFLGVECMWGTMIDGSDPGLSSFAVVFEGYFIGGLTLVWTRGLEEKGDLRSATIWPILFQTLGFGPSMPLFCFLQILSSSKKARHPSPNDPAVLRQWNLLPISIIIGHVIPSFLMVSTRFSTSTHGTLTRAWGLFPLYVLFVQEVLVFVASLLDGKTESSPKNKKPITNKQVFEAHQFTYLFSIRLAALANFSGVALAFTSGVFPSLYRPEVVSSLALKRLFSLPRLDGTEQVGSLQEGMLGLLQWDGFIGGLVGVVLGLWGMSEARTVVRAEKEKGLKKKNQKSGKELVVGEGVWWKDLWRQTLIVGFLGWGASALSTAMDRDEILLLGVDGEREEGQKTE